MIIASGTTMIMAVLPTATDFLMMMITMTSFVAKMDVVAVRTWTRGMVVVVVALSEELHFRPRHPPQAAPQILSRDEEV